MTHPFLNVVDPAAAPVGLEGAVVAIGNFDGLHRGHRAVLARAQALAASLGRPCAVLTFEPHPADYFAKRSVVFRLTPPAEKAAELAALGLDGMIAFTFDQTLAHLSAEQFVAEILVARLGVSAAVVGYDFHFGAQRQGSPAYLRDAGARHGFAVEVVARIASDADGSLEAVSSTATRAALEVGDVARAAGLLGRPWRISGEVLHGRKVGRELGFPTANIALHSSCRLRHGIYAVRAGFDGRMVEGVASFGSRPTFDNGPPLLEVFLFDFSDDLYGQTLTVDFVAFIRDEAKFESVAALVARMTIDVAEARSALAR